MSAGMSESLAQVDFEQSQARLDAGASLAVQACIRRFDGATAAHCRARYVAIAKG